MLLPYIYVYYIITNLHLNITLVPRHPARRLGHNQSPIPADAATVAIGFERRRLKDHPPRLSVDDGGFGAAGVVEAGSVAAGSLEAGGVATGVVF